MKENHCVILYCMVKSYLTCGLYENFFLHNVSESESNVSRICHNFWRVFIFFKICTKVNISMPLPDMRKAPYSCFTTLLKSPPFPVPFLSQPF